MSEAEAVQSRVVDELPEAAPSPALEYAGFGIRFAARAIDVVITYALAFATFFAFSITLAFVAGFAGIPVLPLLARTSEVTAIGFPMSFLATLAYDTLAEGLHGSTPGKMILGLTVLEERGGFCGLPAALGRSLAFFIDSLVFGLPALNSMRRSKRSQRLGDRWAHTVVVYRRSLQPSQRRPGSRFATATAAAALSHCAVLVAGQLLKL